MNELRFRPNRVAIGLALAVGMVPVLNAAPLEDIPESQLLCELSDERMLIGITAGLSARGWIITENDNNGNLVAQVVVRNKHTLIVDIAYTNSSFDINYRDSDNLSYRVRRNGDITIHRNANSWMRNIQQDITAQMNLLCALQ